MEILLFLVIGLISGSLISLVGTGAGLVIIPALVFFAHFSEKMAVGTSLALLLPPVGIFGAYVYWKHGNVDVKAAVFILLGFLVGSYIAARFANDLPSAAISRLFGAAAVAIGIKMMIG